eukprot:scaffold3760_cov73-Skeletonema_dohrnii-CCMP3373.AAC.1
MMFFFCVPFSVLKQFWADVVQRKMGVNICWRPFGRGHFKYPCGLHTGPPNISHPWGARPLSSYFKALRLEKWARNGLLAQTLLDKTKFHASSSYSYVNSY